MKLTESCPYCGVVVSSVEGSGSSLEELIPRVCAGCLEYHRLQREQALHLIDELRRRYGKDATIKIVKKMEERRFDEEEKGRIIFSQQEGGRVGGGEGGGEREGGRGRGGLQLNKKKEKKQ